MTIEILISFVDRDSLTGKLTSYAQGDVVRNLSDEVANAFISAGLAKAYTNLGVAGNISITANGQYDVADYSGATVNVPDFKNLVDGSITEITADMLAGVTSIKLGGLAYCPSLENVTIPDSVTSIGAAAFTVNPSLTSVTLGRGVTSIGDQAFFNCKSLASVTVLATAPPTLGGSAFSDTHSDLKIYVPAELVDAYKTSTYEWVDYADKIQAIPSD